MRKNYPATIHHSIKTALKWISHPIFIFVTLQIVWLAVTLIWVLWFLDSAQEIKKMSELLGHTYLNNHTLVILVVGCILLGVILLGTIILFIKHQKQSALMNQQKSFVSSVTHELRSPLASLKLTFETMKTRVLDISSQKKLLSMAVEDTDRLTRLVDQILVSSRLDRGIHGFEEKAENIDVRTFLSKIKKSVLWLDPEIDSRLKITCPKNLVIHAPYSVLNLIISNLLENAIKYSPKSSPITLWVHNKDKIVTFTVEDQGFGLINKEKKNIFKMFYRAPISHKKAIPGTGLGLYMVRTLAKSLGGNAWAESPGRNQGTKFVLSFPVI